MKAAGHHTGFFLTVLGITLIVFGIVLYLGSVLPFYIFPALILSGVILFFAFQKPWLMIFFIAAGSYLSALVVVFEDFPLPVTLFQTFLIIGLGLYGCHKIYYNSFEIKLTGQELPVLCFLGLIFISLIYSPDRTNGLFNVLRFIILLVFVGYVFNSIHSFRVIEGLFITLTLIAVILSLYSSYEIILNPQIAVQNTLGMGINVERGSAGGIYHDPNRFAAILFLPIAFTFSVINSQIYLKYKLLSGILFILLIAGLASTFSRSGFISVALILLIVVALYNNWKFAMISGLGLLAVVFAVPELRSILFTNIERLLELFSGTRDDSSSIRVLLGIAGLSMFFDSYMIGVGFSGYSEWFTNYFTLQESIGVYEPHNITYTLMAELGLIGLFFFLYYLYVMGNHAIKNIRLSYSPLEKLVSSTLLSSFSAYILFYQFYGGALTDSNLMLIHALIFVVFFQLLDRIEISNQEN